MVCELRSRHQRQLPDQGLPMGPCQCEAQARFLLDEGQLWPVLLCGFMRQAEVISQNWHPRYGHRLRLNPLILTFLRLNFLSALASPSSQPSPVAPVRLWQTVVLPVTLRA